MGGKLFGSALGLGLLLAGPVQMAIGTAPAAAQDWRGHGGYGDYHHDHDGNDAGGVLLGLAAVAGVAALASSAAHHDGYYDRGYAAPVAAYGYQDYQGGYYQGGYGNAAVGNCASAALYRARDFAGDARQGRVFSVDRRGDDVWVRGTVTVGGYDREGDEYAAREVRYTCKFDDGRVRSLRIDRPAYGYGYGGD